MGGKRKEFVSVVEAARRLNLTSEDVLRRDDITKYIRGDAKVVALREIYALQGREFPDCPKHIQFRESDQSFLVKLDGKAHFGFKALHDAVCFKEAMEKLSGKRLTTKTLLPNDLDEYIRRATTSARLPSFDRDKKARVFMVSCNCGNIVSLNSRGACCKQGSRCTTCGRLIKHIDGEFWAESISVEKNKKPEASVLPKPEAVAVKTFSVNLTLSEKQVLSFGMTMLQKVFDGSEITTEIARKLAMGCLSE